MGVQLLKLQLNLVHVQKIYKDGSNMVFIEDLHKDLKEIRF